MNEAANGLAGSDTPLTCLPGGATNVYCRTLGIPADVVDATEHLLRMADDFQPRRVDLGRVNDRYFAFSSGVGPGRQRGRARGRPPADEAAAQRVLLHVGGDLYVQQPLPDPGTPRAGGRGGGQLEGVTVIVQNSDPYTYFGRRPIRICEGIGLETGTLGVTVLRRATPLELPTVAWRAFSGKASTVARHRQIEAFRDVTDAHVEAVDGRPFPVQVDGDFVGKFEEALYEAAPSSLTVVS